MGDGQGAVTNKFKKKLRRLTKVGPSNFLGQLGSKIKSMKVGPTMPGPTWSAGAINSCAIEYMRKFLGLFARFLWPIGNRDGFHWARGGSAGGAIHGTEIFLINTSIKVKTYERSWYLGFNLGTRIFLIIHIELDLCEKWRCLGIDLGTRIFLFHTDALK